ncbi:MAG TPA: hypothetical protein VF756_17940 [Thermoanaerobaculia bacterium]
MSEPRLRREDPDRTEPNRSFSTTLGPDATAAGEDFVTRGVRMGYRLVEEQMRRGQQAAQQASTRFSSSRGDMRDLTERALRFYCDLCTDAALYWFDTAAAMTIPSVPADQPEGEAAAAAVSPAASSSASIPLDIASSRPTRVTLNLQPGSEGLPLEVLPVRSRDVSKPPLMDVSFQTGGTLPVLRIRVPSDQPADLYHGVVCDQQSGAVLGTLSVEIRES